MVESKIKAGIPPNGLRFQTEPSQSPQVKVRIPTEILNQILDILKSNGEFKALTSAARASKAMYDITIPILYKTVVVNEGNRSTIGYGHGSGASVSEQGHGSIVGVNTRKDHATSHTRRLVFDFEPDMAISKSYRAVKEVIIGAQFLVNARRSNHPCGHGPSEEERLRSIWRKCLNVVTSVESSAASLHIQVHLTSRLNYDIIGSQFRLTQSAVRPTWEFFGASVTYGNDVFGFAPWLHAVVHFNIGEANLISQEALLDALGWQLGKSLLIEKDSGPFFLCDIPQIVMSDKELKSATNIDEAAMIKLCSLVSATGITWPDQAGSLQEEKLKFLKSRVKLVKAGFRPSPADMVNTRPIGQDLNGSLVPDDSIRFLMTVPPIQ